jgi:predicted dinucleotide-binding enzyme
MKVGLIGTGMVAQALCGKLAELGHEIAVGARSDDSPSLEPFSGRAGVICGTFSDAAAFGELIVNATNGMHSLEALAAAGENNLAGKPLLDVSNALDRSTGSPKSTATVDNSLGARIQERFPQAKVVKSLNTMNCSVMVDPSLVAGDHVVFVSGDDQQAKDTVKSLLAEFSWRELQIVDLGGIETAASAEMMMPIWLSVVAARGGFQSGPLNFAINGSAG